MGSGSSQLKCPKDFSIVKFEKIVKLFDRLDSDGDHVVESDEVAKIANLHIRNQIGKLKTSIDKISSENDTLKQELDKQLNFDIARLNAKYLFEINALENEKSSNIKDCENEIDRLQNMSNSDKAKKFMKAVSNSKGKIEFWHFYDYMKTRTDDIDNIMW